MNIDATPPAATIHGLHAPTSAASAAGSANTAPPITWLTPIAVRSHRPSARLSAGRVGGVAARVGSGTGRLYHGRTPVRAGRTVLGVGAHDAGPRHHHQASRHHAGRRGHAARRVLHGSRVLPERDGAAVRSG